jgi:uncharacterized integral membrane protein (TIGR00697 family)
MEKLLIGILAMASVVVASNILVQFLLLDGLLTWGAFTYPIAFLITDLMNKSYGPRAARKIVLVGFITGLLCSLIGSKIMLQGDGYEYPAVALRVAFASGIAFILAQFFDIAVFNRLRSAAWWKAPLVSSFLASLIDTTIFFTIAFSSQIPLFSEAANGEISWAWEIVPFLTIGADSPLWISLAVADLMVKWIIGLIALIPFRFFVSFFLLKDNKIS